MSSYKLTYFNARGRAEICRLLFVLAGQEFEDVRIRREEWPALKSKTPFGQLPILEIGGKVFAQTVAISNFLAIEFGFHGKTNLEILAIDQAVCLVQEAVAASSKVFHEPDPERKVHYLKDLKQVVIPHLMSCCETLLVDSGTGYLVGDKLTLADLTVWNYINGTENRLRLTGLADSYPNVKAMFDKVEKEGRIQAYLKQRQPADF